MTILAPQTQPQVQAQGTLNATETVDFPSLIFNTAILRVTQLGSDPLRLRALGRYMPTGSINQTLNWYRPDGSLHDFLFLEEPGIFALDLRGVEALRLTAPSSFAGAYELTLITEPLGRLPSTVEFGYRRQQIITPADGTVGLKIGGFFVLENTTFGLNTLHPRQFSAETAEQRRFTGAGLDFVYPTGITVATLLDSIRVNEGAILAYQR